MANGADQVTEIIFKKTLPHPHRNFKLVRIICEFAHEPSGNTPVEVQRVLLAEDDAGHDVTDEAALLGEPTTVEKRRIESLQRIPTSDFLRERRFGAARRHPPT